jgi:hypothetical protein
MGSGSAVSERDGDDGRADDSAHMTGGERPSYTRGADFIGVASHHEHDDRSLACRLRTYPIEPPNAITCFHDSNRNSVGLKELGRNASRITPVGIMFLDSSFGLRAWSRLDVLMGNETALAPLSLRESY